MLKIVAITLLVVLILGMGLIVWIYRFSGPSLAISEENGAIVVANVFLGEYYLGFTEVEIEDMSTGQTLIRAIRAQGSALRQVTLDPTSDIASVFLDAGWTITAKASDGSMATGTSYRLVLRGNNGFGYDNRTIEVVTIPPLDSGRMPNNRLKLTVTSLACARAAPAA